MAFWILDQWEGTLDYPTLGFIAQDGDVLQASAAPDPRWSSTPSGPETVSRYEVGEDPSYIEPGDGHVLAWSDDDNAYVPKAFVDAGNAFVPSIVEALVPGYVADQVAGHTPGSRLGYTAKTNSFTTTSLFSAPALITGLLTVVTGVGRPAEVAINLPRVYHSTSQGGVLVALWAQKTGSSGAFVQLEEASVVDTATFGSGIHPRYAVTIPNGEEWTYAAYIGGQVAGTTSCAFSTGNPAYIEVVSR